MPRKVKQIKTEVITDNQNGSKCFQEQVNRVYCEIVRQRLLGVRINTEEKLTILESLSITYTEMHSAETREL